MWRRLAYLIGHSLRESGQALDRAGSRLQGDYAFVEQRTISPSVAPSPCLAPGHRCTTNSALHNVAMVVLRGRVWALVRLRRRHHLLTA